MTKILVIHGPNLNLLGTREPEVYGYTTLDDINATLGQIAETKRANLETFQSNHEGYIVDRIHQALTDGTTALLINPGGLTHTSVVLRDALAALRAKVLVIEVHLSVPEARESFRHHSMIAGVVQGRVSGFGADSYYIALEGAFRFLKNSEASLSDSNP